MNDERGRHDGARFPIDPGTPEAEKQRSRPFPEDPALARALGYPFDIPGHSFVLEAAGPRPMAVTDWSILQDRWPVVACGSNQSIAQLMRKYSGHLESPLPVVKASLADHDSVYSAHFAAYGSLAATLCASPGTVVELAVTFLDDRQLQRMHATEALGVNYDYITMKGLDLTLENGQILGSAFTYGSRWGALNHDGTPVPLAEIQAAGRIHEARGQREIQDLARARLAPETGLGDFIRENIGDVDLRQSRTRRLATDALPLDR